MHQVICDTHVHCYKYDEFTLLLNHAYNNMSAEMNNRGVSEFSAVLFFTNSQLDQSWRHIEKFEKKEINHWRIEKQEDGLLKASHQNKQIFLAPAKQVNSIERLEFLLLGSEHEVTDGLSGQQIISQNCEHSAVICPWGVGKWLGKRSVVLSHLIVNQGKQFLLGDNGGRPSFWFHVPHFKQTNQPILNGSDPLPIQGEINRVGSFGITFKLDNKLTLESLIAALKNPTIKKYNYGKPLGLIDFIKGRIALSRQNSMMNN